MQHYPRHAQFGNFKFRSRRAHSGRATHQCFHFKQLEFSFFVLILDEISFTYFQIPLKLPKIQDLKIKLYLARTFYTKIFLKINSFTTVKCSII